MLGACCSAGWEEGATVWGGEAAWELVDSRGCWEDGSSAGWLAKLGCKDMQNNTWTTLRDT
eukprot:1154782-Pelagomonas_calceolata.AAC.5